MTDELALQLERRRSLDQRGSFLGGTSTLSVAVIVSLLGVLKPTPVALTGGARLTLLIATACFAGVVLLSLLATVRKSSDVGVAGLSARNATDTETLWWATMLEFVGIIFLGLAALVLAMF